MNESEINRRLTNLEIAVFGGETRESTDVRLTRLEDYAERMVWRDKVVIVAATTQTLAIFAGVITALIVHFGGIR